VSGDTERPPARLVTADGEVFEGEAAGASPPGGIATGELVFNTALSGYQEVVTDPSYAGQVVAFTYPHIGNYGVNGDDDEAPRPFCEGVVVRDLVAEPSNWRAEGGLEAFLVRHRVPAITGVDTRRLTRHVRRAGALPCAFGTAPEAQLAEAARRAPGTDGRDLVVDVTTTHAYTLGAGPRRIVAVDLGIKATMLRQLATLGAITVVPAATGAAEVLALGPDGVFVSNGPGDPAALEAVTANLSDLIGRVPIFGICLGHQVLARALGAATYKLAFGHHGANHPVRRLDTGQVEVTSQNHNYAVDAASLRGAEVTHVNLNDGVVEGIRVPGAGVLSVQYHPEAGPGPHDARYLFGEFEALMAAGAGG
jgi:carbamoyl-phosphate synthase small subunit